VKKGGPILTIYTSYDVLLHRELPLGVMMIAPALKFLALLIFFNRDSFFNALIDMLILQPYKSYRYYLTYSCVNPG